MTRYIDWASGYLMLRELTHTEDKLPRIVAYSFEDNSDILGKAIQQACNLPDIDTAIKLFTDKTVEYSHFPGTKPKGLWEGSSPSEKLREILAHCSRIARTPTQIAFRSGIIKAAHFCLRPERRNTQTNGGTTPVETSSDRQSPTYRRSSRRSRSRSNNRRSRSSRRSRSPDRRSRHSRRSRSRSTDRRPRSAGHRSRSTDRHSSATGQGGVSRSTTVNSQLSSSLGTPRATPTLQTESRNTKDHTNIQQNTSAPNKTKETSSKTTVAPSSTTTHIRTDQKLVQQAPATANQRETTLNQDGPDDPPSFETERTKLPNTAFAGYVVSRREKPQTATKESQNAKSTSVNHQGKQAVQTQKEERTSGTSMDTDQSVITEEERELLRKSNLGKSVLEEIPLQAQLVKQWLGTDDWAETERLQLINKITSLLVKQWMGTLQTVLRKDGMIVLKMIEHMMKPYTGTNIPSFMWANLAKLGAFSPPPPEPKPEISPSDRSTALQVLNAYSEMSSIKRTEPPSSWPSTFAHLLSPWEIHYFNLWAKHQARIIPNGESIKIFDPNVESSRNELFLSLSLGSSSHSLFHAIQHVDLDVIFNYKTWAASNSEEKHSMHDIAEIFKRMAPCVSHFYGLRLLASLQMTNPAQESEQQPLKRLWDLLPDEPGNICWQIFSDMILELEKCSIVPPNRFGQQLMYTLKKNLLQILVDCPAQNDRRKYYSRCRLKMHVSIQNELQKITENESRVNSTTSRDPPRDSTATSKQPPRDSITTSQEPPHDSTATSQEPPRVNTSASMTAPRVNTATSQEPPRVNTSASMTAPRVNLSTSLTAPRGNKPSSQTAARGSPVSSHLAPRSSPTSHQSLHISTASQAAARKKKRNSRIRCRYGDECRSKKCDFLHPNGRNSPITGRNKRVKVELRSVRDYSSD